MKDPVLSRLFRGAGFVLFLAVASATGLYAVTSYTSTISELSRLEPAAGPTVTDATLQNDLIGSFSLTDQNGVAVTDQSYAGQYRLVFFGFTSCPEVCPTGLKKLTAALDLLGKDGEAIVPLFITIDPERDTPQVMKEYAALYSDRLIGLSGAREQTEAAEKSFKVYAAKREGGDVNDYMYDHSAFIYLQDPQSRLVGFFGSDDTAADIAAEVKRLTGRS